MDLKEKEGLIERLRRLKGMGLRIDMTRGKPSEEQLDLSMGLLEGGLGRYRSIDGLDCRNYGCIEGVIEARELFGECYGLGLDEIIIGGGSSLNLMHDVVVMGLLKGLYLSDCGWVNLGGVKFLCPSPGYDRHFDICDQLGIEMIPVKMTGEGPDMEEVERLVGEDEMIKGIWCVPKYSNPTGEVYSGEVIRALAKMRSKAKDFYIFWDNAYVVHFLDFEEGYIEIENILTECKRFGNPDRVLIYGSTSKMTFPGGGVSILGGSALNIEYFKREMSKQRIGSDKINQLRQVDFFKDMNGIIEHMKKHAQIIKPRFDRVDGIFKEHFKGKSLGVYWTNPRGGYFMDLRIVGGRARKVVELARELGVIFSDVGQTFPYKEDGEHIRIAPTYPKLEELEKAIEALCLCIEITNSRDFKDGILTL